MKFIKKRIWFDSDLLELLTRQGILHRWKKKYSLYVSDLESCMGENSSFQQEDSLSKLRLFESQHPNSNKNAYTHLQHYCVGFAI